MSTKFYGVITTMGMAKLANAIALKVPLDVTHMAVGDGGGSLPMPDIHQTSLMNETYRGQMNTLFADPDNTHQIIAELVIPATIGGWWVRESGLYDSDGDLIAVTNAPESYKPQMAEGSGRDQVLRMVLVVSSTEAVTLKIDPATVLATRQYVDDAITVVARDAKQALDAHKISRDHPEATTSEKGFVVLSDDVDSADKTKAATADAVRRAHELADSKVLTVNEKSPDDNKNITLTHVDVDAVSATTGGQYGGAVSATYTESYAFVDQYETKAPFYNDVIRNPNSEFHPILKQRFHIPGHSAYSYAFGVLNGGDGTQDFKLNIAGSGGQNISFTYSTSGDFNAPASIRAGAHVYSAYHVYAGGGNACLRNDGQVAGPLYGGTITEWVNRYYISAIRRGAQQYIHPGNWWVDYEVPDGYITGFHSSTGDGNIRFAGFYYRIPMIHISGQWVNAGNY